MNQAVYLARHAESRWNAATAEERKNGRGLRDADLSARGHDQLARLSKEMPPELWKVRAIFCSPLIRAIRTAESIAAVTGGCVTAVACLREIRRDVGDVGSPPGTLLKLFPGVRGLDALPENWWTTPGCKACRDTHECQPCCAMRLKELRRLVLDSAGPILLVTHCDILVATCGWDAKNAEIARARPL